MRYSVIAARDGDTYHDEVSADNQEEAETKAREQLAEAWHMQSELKQAREEGDESAFDAELDGFAVDPDERSTMTLNAAQLYRQLADGLSDMIEGGRLTVGDIPDDYQWLVNLLEKIVGEDPGDQTTIEVIRSMHEDADEPVHVPGLNENLAPADQPKFAPGDRVYISKVGATKTVIRGYKLTRGEHVDDRRYVLKDDRGVFDEGWRECELQLAEGDA